MSLSEKKGEVNRKLFLKKKKTLINKKLVTR